MTNNDKPGAVFARRHAAHLRLDSRGERLACRLLKSLGMEVLTCNYGGRRGEIDIVARDGSVLCFVEVKTRRRADRSRPAAAVTRTKKRRIVRTAERYFRQIGHPPVVYRFDIVEIVVSGRRVKGSWHWPNTFSGEDAGRPTHRPFAVF